MAERNPIELLDLERCFFGIIPATLATCSPEGVPNLTYLSVVHAVDERQLALSVQFFNKTWENLGANPKAQILVPHPETLEQFRIDAVYERTVAEGPIFDRMRSNLDAVASATGLEGVFRLKGAAIFRVLAIERLAHDLDLGTQQLPSDHVAALEALSAQMDAASDLDSLLDVTLAGLDAHLSLSHSMVLLMDETDESLYTVASRGFRESGVGAEVRVGQGLIGTAARDRRLVHFANQRFDRLMAQAVRGRAGPDLAREREIPLPGLPNAPSQLAVPIVARDRTLGVLCLQSDVSGRFSRADEQALTTLCRHLAISMQLLSVSSAALESADSRAYAPPQGGTRSLVVRYHEVDASVFVDGEYVIKGAAGRILWRLLNIAERDGRVDFTNRELRLDPELPFGGYRDNLEARLILLRKRIEERCTAMRIRSTGRGRFRVELERAIALEKA